MLDSVSPFCYNYICKVEKAISKGGELIKLKASNSINSNSLGTLYLTNNKDFDKIVL